MGKNNIEKNQTFREDIMVRLIKILNMGYTNIIYVIPTIFIATLLDKHIYSNIQIGSIPNDEEKTILSLLSELLIILTIGGITAYVLRNILQKMPFPFEGVYGFNSMKIQEVKTGATIALVLMYFCPVLVNKLKLLQQKFNKIL